MAQQKEPAIHTFVLGNKELEGKTAEFRYDHGWYSIIDIVGEARDVIYKSKNAQEAYMKWNVYIGRKKERPERPERAERQERQEHPPQEKSSDNRKREKNRAEDRPVERPSSKHSEESEDRPRKRHRPHHKGNRRPRVKTGAEE